MARGTALLPALAALALAFSCSDLSAPGIPAREPPAGLPEEELVQASVKLTLPSIAPWIVTSKPGSPSRSASKAYMGATSLQLRVYYYDNNWGNWVTRGDYYFTPTLSLDKTDRTSISVTQEVPTGYLYVDAWIFNSQNPEGGAVVAGTSAPFTATAEGPNEFTIACSPTAMEEIPIGTPSEQYAITLQGERWFHIQPSTTSTVTCTTVTGDADLYLFNYGDKTFIAKSVLTEPVDSINISGQVDYYFAVWGYAAGTFTIIYTEAQGELTGTIY